MNAAVALPNSDGAQLIARPSSPSVGRSLGRSVTLLDPPIRKALEALLRDAGTSTRLEANLYTCMSVGPGAEFEAVPTRVAWTYIAVALVHARSMKRTRVGAFKEALAWFFGEQREELAAFQTFFHDLPVKSAERALGDLDLSPEFWDLLPYVLEPHGHVTRSRLEQCDLSRATRNLKKAEGVYYTPSDVADFMVAELWQDFESGTWLDPACGSGVFLRSILDRAKEAAPDLNAVDFVRKSVFGIDKSALSTDLSAFVLLADTVDGLSGQLPVSVWQSFKHNLVCADALRISGRGVPDINGLTTRLSKLFPSIGERGFDRIVMNPPYSSSYVDDLIARIWTCSSIGGTRTDSHVLFSELMTRFVATGGSTCAVLPLSIGANTNARYKKLRAHLKSVQASKDFLFFDREPQALFGEDIKTRNVILFVRNVGGDSGPFRSSRLLKWTGIQRKGIFRTDRLVEVEAERCLDFVPKLGTFEEKELYDQVLGARELSITALPDRRFTRTSLDEATQCGALQLLVSSTAYNFINCFFSDGLDESPPRPYSVSQLNAISAASAEEAMALIAVTSSRLCYWLWHVEGDGFHVTGEFLKRLPLWHLLLNDEVRRQLAAIGKQYWSVSRAQRIGSVNGGKQTYSFHCSHPHPLLLEAEKLILSAMGINERASRTLDAFIATTVFIDGSQRDRRVSAC